MHSNRLMLLFTIFLFFPIVFCDIKSCTDERNYKKIRANTICFKEDGSSQTLPIELDTILYVKEIVSINEQTNSISIQMVLHTSWKNDEIKRTYNETQ